MNYHINPDEEWVQEFKKELRANGKYCPSKLERNKTTKCICKEFKEQEHGWCSCGLYYKD